MKARIDEIMVPMIREGIVDLAEAVAIHAAVVEFKPDAEQLAKYGQWLQEGLESLKHGYTEPTAESLAQEAIDLKKCLDGFVSDPNQPIFGFARGES